MSSHMPPSYKTIASFCEYTAEMLEGVSDGAELIKLPPRQPGAAKRQSRYGADIRLPDLREEIAKCDRHGKMHDACMVRYVDLIPKR